ncbi:MAG: hypothetical protein QOJ98_452 [Acidobacteriota bacterium]|jgi:hypothetical protein|nr:hypothetical protein [Acidobacteriota bacterium]
MQINGHGFVAVALLIALWWTLVSSGDVPTQLIVYFAAVSILYALLIITNVDNQTSRRDPEDQQDASFQRTRMACGAHLFFTLAVVALKTALLPRVGLLWTFVIALTAGLAVPFMLFRRVAPHRRTA